LLLFLIFALSPLAVILKSEKGGDRFWLLLTWSLSLSLLLSVTLLSNNLLGYDVHDEYFRFLAVSKTGIWDVTNFDPYNSVISVTILPAVLSAVSGLDGISIFKFVFPVLYSFAPVILYKVYRKILSPRAAFLSVFLFISYPTFYGEMIQLGRQEIAEILLLVLIWIFLSTQTMKISGRLAIVILTIGLVTAHYALAYIYLVFLTFSFVVSRVSRRTITLGNSFILLLTAVATLVWYAFAAGGVGIFDLYRSVSPVIQGFWQSLFFEGSRPSAVLQAAGLAPGLPGIVHDLNRVTLYLAQICLVLGFLAFVFKKRKSVAEQKMLPLMTIGLVFLGCAVILPFFAAQLELTRIYHITLLFVSPCFVYGADQLGRVVDFVFSLRKGIKVRFRKKQVLAAVILVSYFLFVSGWAWAATMDRPDSLILDVERIRDSPDVTLSRQYFLFYTVLPDIAGARWLNDYRDTTSPICADFTARYHVLNSYGEIPRDGLNSAKQLTGCTFKSSYVFLSEFNTQYGIAYTTANGPDYGSFSLSKISARLSVKNTVFSDGGAVIYA
jgi:uncharacterized membrane protein